MTFCTQCGAQIDETQGVCPNCGAYAANPNYANPGAANPNYANPGAAYQAPVDIYDHTAEFDPADISENKVVSMLVYLMGWVGIIIALLASNTSKYAAFHVRQALKFVVIEALIPIVITFGAVINIIPILGTIVWGLAALALSVFAGVLAVVKIICFFQICKGQAKEPPILCKLNFLR